MSAKVTDNIHSDLKFIDYVVEKIEFYHNHNFEEEPVSIDVKANSKISYADPDKEKPNLDRAAVNLKLDIFEDPVENNYPFSLFVDVIGYFEINHSDKKLKKNLLEKNSLAILFPYVRSIISTITANSNVQPLNLPPLNINKLIDEKRVEKKEVKENKIK